MNGDRKTARQPQPIYTEGEAAIIPVFPLGGVLLLPEARLPLHIFEPRYRNLVRDVIDDAGIIGLVQPCDPTVEPPALYDVGCSGEIESYQRLTSGRYLILLRGLRRFRTLEEVDTVNGYRRLAVRFDPPLAGEPVVPTAEMARVFALLTGAAARRQLEIDLGRLYELPPLLVINTLAVGLPFAPEEKQALLEAPDAARRLDLLLALLAMGFETGESHRVH